MHWLLPGARLGRRLRRPRSYLASEPVGRAWHHRCRPVRCHRRHAYPGRITTVRHSNGLLQLRIPGRNHTRRQPRCLHSGRWHRRCRELRLVWRPAIYRRRLDDQRLAIQRLRLGQLQHRHALDLHVRTAMRRGDHPPILLPRDGDSGQRSDSGRHMGRWLDHDGLQGTHGWHQRLLRRFLWPVQRPAPQDRCQRRALLQPATM